MPAKICCSDSFLSNSHLNILLKKQYLGKQQNEGMAESGSWLKVLVELLEEFLTVSKAQIKKLPKI